MSLPIFNNHFWAILKQIDELTEMVELESFLAEFSGADFNCEIIYDVLQFLSDLNYPVQIEEIKGEKYLLPNSRAEKINFSLSFSDWIALQAHLPLLHAYKEHDFSKSIHKAFADISAKYPAFNLNQEGSSTDELSFCFKETLSDLLLKYVNHVEEAFKVEALLLVSVENKTYEIYPHKLIMLEGELTLIGEETTDRCLVSYSLEEVSKIKLNKINEYTVNYSRFEVDEFVMAIRAVSGREERLVLKIDQNKPVNLNPAYQFLGHPYMTANSEGDFIWAASVEISSPLYDWIISMGESVEILDPADVRSEFEKYREIKLKDMAKKNLKKAS